MRPKNPSSPTTRTDSTTHAPSISRPRPDADLPLLHRPPSELPDPAAPVPSPGRLPDAANVPPKVETSDLPAIQTESRAGLTPYLLSPALLRNMQAADDNGFRFVVGRRFVDIKDVGTVHVEFDTALNAYRITDLYKKLPPGPQILRTPGETTWTPVQQAQTPSRHKHTSTDDAARDAATTAKRPTLSPPPTQPAKPLPALSLRHFNPAHYPQVQVDAQGYYRREEVAFDPQRVTYHYGFRDTKDYWVAVDEPPAGFNGTPTHLTNWTDHEIWQTYGLHGQAISRFRLDAQTHGTRPGWARPLETDNPRKDLLGDALKWLHPQMTPDERVAHLRAYNLSPGQHAQLRKDLLDNPQQMPQWAEQHKLRSVDENDPTRFEPLRQEIEPLLLPLRNGTIRQKSMFDLDESISPTFFAAFLTSLGYKRNASDCLYRTDIPGLFRADERTPFEFNNDGRMLPRMLHKRGATSEKPISATISLKLVHEYAGQGSNAPDPEYLRYNNQKNKYPGKKPGESDNDSGESDNEWSDTSDVELDAERNYETIRHDQSFIFKYVIDTRNMEVVLREENLFLNGGAEERGAWFPEDENEALISASRRGIPTERIWLLDSTGTRAVKVDDVVDQAPYLNSMEEDTHSGSANQHEYDALIDAATEAGKPVLYLDKGKEWFANDIVWPE
ncbi:hypothetical protein ACKUG4_16685 [Pseudomonas glycinae]|uniref:hypothetical protein n=1 Tax=Candidatus Pseudomonas auctus TaxID=3461260 RepID=UPI003B8F84C6